MEEDVMPAGSLWLKVMLPEALTLAPSVIPAPALTVTVRSPEKVALRRPPTGLAASQTTLPVPTPEQACASDAQTIAASETDPSSAPRHIVSLPPMPIMILAPHVLVGGRF